MEMNVFTPLAGGGMETYKYPTEYPFDLDASLDFTRPQTGFSIFPFPLTIGFINGLVPMFNNMEYSLMLGLSPKGPWSGEAPNTGAELSFVFPDLMGGLSKVKG